MLYTSISANKSSGRQGIGDWPCLSLTYSGKCPFKKYIYISSKKNSKAFEVNRRAVLATRNTAVGQQSLVKFKWVMNMSPLMNGNACKDHVQATHTEAESMSKAADDVKTF